MISLIRGVGFFAGFCIVFAVVFGMTHAVSPKPRILMVDDDYTSNVYEYYWQALNYAGYSYYSDSPPPHFDMVHTSSGSPYGPSYDEMKDYDIVVWLTGRMYVNTFLEYDRTQLGMYLDDGGALFISGEQIPYDANLRGSDFYTDYLGSGKQGPGYEFNSLAEGVIDNPVTGDLGDFWFRDYCYSCPYSYCSSINWSCEKKYLLYPVEDGGGSVIYDSDSSSSKIEGVRVDSGTFKVVYFAFGFEQMSYGYFGERYYEYSALRGELLLRVINYLYGPYAYAGPVEPVITNSDPAIHAICKDEELYSYVNSSEYFVRSIGSAAPTKADYGDGVLLDPKDGGFDEADEVVNGSVDISGLDDGDYTVYVHCQDKSGYWGRFDNSNFTVDTTAPAPPQIMIGYGDNFTNYVMPMISITDTSGGGNKPDYIAFSCDNSNYSDWIPWTTYYDAFNITGIGCGLSDGVKTVYVKGKDEAGNVPTFDPDSDDIVLDRVAPLYVVEDFYPVNGSYVQGIVDVSYNVSEDWEFHYLYYYDSEGDWGTIYSGNGTMSLVWSIEGEKRLDMWAYDKAWNMNYTHLDYFVDLHAPFFESVEPVNGSYVRACDNVTVDVSDNYNLSLFWYNNNAGSGNVSVDDDFSFNPNWTVEGGHFLDVWANDSAGNVNHDRYWFVVDDTLPAVSYISYANESNVSSSFSFVVNTSDNYEVSLRYYSNESEGENKTFEDLESFVPGWIGDGSRTLLLWAVDGAGNVFSDVYSYFVDDTAPYIVSAEPVFGSVVRSDLNITIDANDAGVGISQLVYSNDSTDGGKAFSDNVGFNPGWSGEGVRYLFLWINDTLGNMNHTVYSYIVDDTAPAFVSVVPDNGSYVTFETNVTVGLYDVNGVDVSWYNNGSVNVTFDSSCSFNPWWGVEGGKELYVWANDSAGNVNEKLYYFVVDDSSPVIGIVPSNGSFVKSDDEIVLYSIDSGGAGVDELWYFNGSGVNHTVFNATGFSPGWSADGNYTLFAWSNDTLDNVNFSVFGFYVDGSGPNSSSNYTSGEWVMGNQDVLLVCDDGSGAGCDATMSCVRNYGSTECLSYSELDVVTVSCPSGETCQKYVYFRSNDSLGNYGPFNDSGVVRIDKEAPLVTVQNPKSMQIVSGMVDILTEVSDSGVGVNASWYDINVTVANGTLNESSLWDDVWNSSEVSDGNYNLTVYANDSFGYVASVSVQFMVDNNLPTAAVYYPKEEYMNTDFSLDLRAGGAGGNLANCSYYVYNATVVLNWSFKPVSSSQCNFSWVVDTSLWATGNYSINFTAFDEVGNNASDMAWFVFDVDKPVVLINSPGEGAWAKDEIDVNYSVADDYVDLCYYRHRDAGYPFSDYYSIGCGSFLVFGFATSVCSDTNTSGCVVEVNSTDKAGNSGSLNVSFNVDNSLPVVSIFSPLANSWQNGTFSLGHSEVDLQGQSCGYRVVGSSDSSWLDVDCSVGFDVDVSSYCLNEGWSFCRVFVNSTNYVGDAVVKSRNFSIDLGVPYFVSVSRENNSFMKSSANIRVVVDDSLSGVAGLMYDNGSGVMVAVGDNVEFCPGWSLDGYNVLGLWVVDAAGNYNYSSYSYFVDDAAPYIAVASPVNGSSIRVGGNVTVDVIDDGAGLDVLMYDGNEFGGNVSFDDDVGFSPWDSGGDKTLDLWLFDALGNMNHTVFEYFVDTVAPGMSVSFLNGSFIRSSDNLSVVVDDVGIGVNLSWYYPGYGSNVSFGNGVSFSPGWVSEGAKDIVFYANDSFGNLNISPYVYVVDDGAPLIDNVWVNGSAVAKDGHVLVSVNVSDAYSGVDSVSVDVLNTSMDVVDTVGLNGSSGSSVYAGAFVIGGEDSGNYTLNVSVNDTVGWVSYDVIEFVVDSAPPTVSGAGFDALVDELYLDKRVYQNESVSFLVNVSDRQVDSVVATVALPSGVANYSLLPVDGNYSCDTWNFTLYDTAQPGLYSVSAIYANDSVGNVNVTSSGLDEFVVVGLEFFVMLDGADYISAGENKSLNLSFDFNRTVDYPNVSFYVPLNSPSNSSEDVYFLNNSVFVCGYGGGGCSLASSVDGDGRVVYVNVSADSSGSYVSVYSESMGALYPLNDSNFTWYADFLGYVYSNSTLVRTPNLNVSSVLCDSVSGCVVNQSEGFVLNVSVDNVYMAGNHTGDAYGVVLYLDAGSFQLNESLGGIGSGGNKNVGWSVNVTSAGNFTMSFVARDATLRYNSSVLNVSLEVLDTERPMAYGPFWDGSSSVYVNESVSIGVWASDNVNVSSVFGTVVLPNSTVENVSFYLDIGSRQLGIWKLGYNRTFSAGDYNVTSVFLNDTVGNAFVMPLGYVFSVVNLSVVAGVSLDVLNVSDALGIYANVSGNATEIEMVEAVISKPRGAVEVEVLSYAGSGLNGTHAYQLNYDNVSRSGNYSVNVTVYASRNKSSVAEFFANYGSIDVVFSGSGDSVVVPSGGVHNLTWFIVPVSGDVVGVNSSVVIENASVANLTSGDFNVSVGNVTVEDNVYGYMISWEVNFSDVGLSNMTVVAESGVLGVSDSATVLLNVTLGDFESPDIGDSSVGYGIVNLYEVNSMYVNASDNSLVDNVSFEVHYPGGAFLNHTAVVVGPGQYMLDFSHVNETGNFSCRIYAYDVCGNVAVRDCMFTFNSTDEYDVSMLADYGVYNKGETAYFTVEVSNVNNVSVSGYNLSMILNDSSSLEYLVDDEVADGSSKYISISDPPTGSGSDAVYVVNASVFKDGNQGSALLNITVSNILFTEITSLAYGDYYASGNAVPINVTVSNRRGEGMSDARVSATCGSSVYGVEHVTSNLYVYMDYLAPSLDNFGVIVDSIDSSRNGGLNSVTLTTIESVSLNPSGPGGGTDGTGGAGGAGAVGGNWSEPADDKVVPDKVVVKRRSFDFTLMDFEVEVVSGFDATFYGHVANTGDVPLVVESRVSKECCNVSVGDEFTLPVGHSFDFPVDVHVPLFVPPGDYVVQFVLFSGSSEKLKTVTLIVSENRDVVLMQRLKSILAEIGFEIEMYDSRGFDVNELKVMSDDIGRLISVAEGAVEDDDVAVLQRAVLGVQLQITEIKSRLMWFKVKKFLLDNKEMFLLLFFMMFFSIYLLTEIVLPYMMLGEALVKLNGRRRIIEKTKKSAEKQYFRREIDETVFNRIMIDEQSKLLKTRSEIAEIEDYMALLKRGKTREFKRLRAEREGRHRDVLKMQTIESALKRSTADFLKEKIRDSRIMLFFVKLRNRLADMGSAKEDMSAPLPAVRYPDQSSRVSEDGEVREIIEKLKKAASELDEEDE